LLLALGAFALDAVPWLAMVSSHGQITAPWLPAPIDFATGRAVGLSRDASWNLFCAALLGALVSLIAAVVAKFRGASWAPVVLVVLLDVVAITLAAISLVGLTVLALGRM